MITAVLRLLRALWRDHRFRYMLEAVIIAVAGYLTAVVTLDAPTP